MSTNLELALWLRLHGNDAAAAGIRRFTEATRQGFGQVSASVRQAWHDLNGFSAASKLVAAAGGMALVRNAIDANLDFEKKILEMKQLAEMTQAQAEGMRRVAIDRAQALLATPQEIAEGMRLLANAGMKYEDIAKTIEEAARAALAFRSTVGDIANMDFDIQTKFHVDPSRMAAMHDMLYYHSKQGRFEAKSLSMYAPEYLNEMARVGMGGEKALNFAGALTQVMQKIKPATQPGEVSTLIKHGLGHITDKMYVKHIKAATGIDVESYMPDGKFYGEGGVQGMLDLAKALKAKGLDNPFKMSQAGFRDQYTRDFWLQMIKSIAEIEEQMKLADAEAGKGTLSKDVDEIRGSRFGRVKKGQVAGEQAKVGDAASGGAEIWAKAMGFVGDHPGEAAGLAATGLIGGRYLWNRMRRGGAGGGIAGAAGALGGAQKVFVTNWPTGQLSPGEMLNQKRANLPGGWTTAAGGAAQGAASRFAWARGLGLGALPLAVMAGVTEWAGDPHDLSTSENSKGRAQGLTGLSAALARVLSVVGFDKEKEFEERRRKNREGLDLSQPQTINIQIDGRTVAQVVNDHNARQARRN